MKIAEKLSSLYKSGVTAHELRLSRADDSEHCVTTFEGNKIKNPFMEDTRPKIDRFLGSLPPDMLEKEALQAELMLEVLDDAERLAREALTSGDVVGMGYRGPSDQSPCVIPEHHWHFLTVDFDEGTAAGDEFAYAGLRFLYPEKLSDEELNLLISDPVTNDRKSSATSEQVDSDPTNRLDVFREMEDLTWPEVSMILVAGALIEITARGTTKRVAYAELGLIDMRIDKGELTRAGRMFIEMATGAASKDPQYTKNLSRLRAKLKNTFGIKADPFHPTQFRNKHFAVFKLFDERDRPDRRAKLRASHVELSDKAEYRVGQKLSEDLAEQTREYPFENIEDESSEEGGPDLTDEWFKKNVPSYRP